MYVAGKCRCDECREANRIGHAVGEKLKREGRSMFVAAEPVRKRWMYLRGRGMSNDEIERAAGLDDKVSHDLLIGHWRTGKPLTRINRFTAEKIMALNHRSLLRGTCIKAPDLREMTIDLMSLGYSGAWIADQLGMSYQGQAPLLRHTVRAGTYAKMLELHGSTIEQQTAATREQESSITRSKNTANRLRCESNGSVVIDVKALRRVMNNSGVTDKEFQEAHGFATGHLAHIMERGSCRAITADRIASALGVEADLLLVQS